MQTPPDPAFIPLAPSTTSASGERRDFGITVASQAANAQPFHALGHKSSATPAAGNSSREPRITLRRENDRISAVVVECSCGQTIELACVYDEPAIPQPAPPAITPPPVPMPAPVPQPAAPAARPPAPQTAKAKAKSPARKSKR